MKKIFYLFVSAFLFLMVSLNAQSQVEIIGDLKVNEVDTISYAESVLTQKEDGTVVSIPSYHLNLPEGALDLPFAEGWENYGANYQPCTYHLHGSRVHISGLAHKSSGPIELGDTLAILPEAYRPLERTMGFGKYDVLTTRLNIEPDGTIWVVSGPTGQDWMDLTGISFREKPYNIGDFYEGGIIFYIASPQADLDGDGFLDKGLIASISDLPQHVWGCYGTEIDGAYGQNIGTGNDNTLDIISGCSENNIAALECANLVTGGYSDWFLPSRNEMIKVNETIGFLASGDNYNIGNFSSDLYSTSTQYNEDWYNIVNFSNGTSGVVTKLQSTKIRPIRVF